MSSTAEILRTCCLQDLIPPKPVLIDYFGASASNDQEIPIILGIYQCLIKQRGVKLDLLVNCFLSNRLNELVHAKFKHIPTRINKKFCDIGGNLESTALLQVLPESEWMPIYDNDHCPNCNKEGYLTQNLKGNLIDCPKCFRYMCKQCNQPNSERCKKCYDPNEDSDEEWRAMFEKLKRE